jgi:hypothetical protein
MIFIMGDPEKYAAQRYSPNGKTAWMIHGLALLALAFTIVCGHILESEIKEAEACIAVGAAATLIWGLWSLILAGRSLRKGERSAWPLALFLFVLFEISIVAQGAWTLYDYQRPQINPSEFNWILDVCLCSAMPVFLPFLFVVGCIGWPIAAWRVRRAEKLAEAAGAQPWTRSRRCKRALAWFAAIALLLALLILPAPLFLYCAVTTDCPYISMGKIYKSLKKNGFRNEIIEKTPNFIRDSVDTVLNWLPFDRCAALEQKLLGHGAVSKAQFLKHLHGANAKLFDISWFWLTENYPEEALPMAVDMCASTSGQDIAFQAGWLLGKMGDEQKIEQCLKKAAELHFEYDVLYGIFTNLNPQSFKYWEIREHSYEGAKSNLQSRALILSLLAKTNIKENEEGCWRELLGDKDVLCKRASAEALSDLPNNDMKIRLIFKALKDHDLDIRRNAARAVWRASPGFSLGSSSLDIQLFDQRGIKSVIELLNDSDFFVRRCVSGYLSESLNLHINTEPANVSAGADPLPEQPGEAEACAQIRAAAEKYLAEKAKRSNR